MVDPYLGAIRSIVTFNPEHHEVGTSYGTLFSSSAFLHTNQLELVVVKLVLEVLHLTVECLSGNVEELCWSSAGHSVLTLAVAALKLMNLPMP